MPDTQDVVSLMSAALEAQISRERMMRALCNGDVRGQKIDGRYYVTRESLDRFIARRRTAPARARRAS